jgi:hypothetical protein
MAFSKCTSCNTTKGAKTWRCFVCENQCPNNSKECETCCVVFLHKSEKQLKVGELLNVFDNYGEQLQSYITGVYIDGSIVTNYTTILSPDQVNKYKKDGKMTCEDMYTVATKCMIISLYDYNKDYFDIQGIRSPYHLFERIKKNLNYTESTMLEHMHLQQIANDLHISINVQFITSRPDGTKGFGYTDDSTRAANSNKTLTIYLDANNNHYFNGNQLNALGM